MKILVSAVVATSILFQSSFSLAETNLVEEAKQSIVQMNNTEVVKNNKKRKVELDLATTLRELKSASDEAKNRGHVINNSDIANLAIFAAGIAGTTTYVSAAGLSKLNLSDKAYKVVLRMGNGALVVLAAAAIAGFLKLVFFSDSGASLQYQDKLRDMTNDQLEAEIKSLVVKFTTLNAELKVLEAEESALKPPRHVGPEL